jgi:CMP-N-acetylneuraminic acid synthetase
MIVALSAGRKSSKGFPDKNIYKIDSYHLMEYPLIAAKNCKLVDEIYFSSDCDVQMKLAEKHGASLFSRPSELATDKALLEDVYVWMFNRIKKDQVFPFPEELKYIDSATYREYFHFEFIIILMSNAPCVTSKMIEEMILILRNNKQADSICTISKYNMFHPIRSRKFENEYLIPGVNECYNSGVNCDRDCSYDNWIYDCSCAVVRPICLENLSNVLIVVPLN